MTHFSTGIKAFGLALAATLFAAPLAVHGAIDIPHDPLQSAGRVAPNLLFILDDSGSMSFDAMPANSISGFKGQTYVHNTIYYNPFITYQAWRNADGSRMTSGTSYNAVYGSYNLVGGSTVDLANSRSCVRFNRNSSATDDEPWLGGAWVCGGVQNFFVPKNVNNTSQAYLNNQGNFYLYQIRADGRVIRCNDYDSYAGSWSGCVYATPTGRTEAAERANYATWFSYHRTRMKAAKAGAGDAFSELGMDVRVGFRTIWARNGGSSPGNLPTHSVPIPVNYNDGLFADLEPLSSGGVRDNRTQWYQRLYGSIGYNGTPLHGALDQAGRYFQSRASNGPWGPQASRDQYSCRQNFSILTTDGFWNDASFNYYERVGEQDNRAGVIISGPNNPNYQYLPSRPYAGWDSDTLADVAMKYWKEDLRDDMVNNVPSSGKNPAFWQNMVTFGISIGLKGTLDPASDLLALTDGTKVWPNPNRAEDSTRIDDLWHAAVNGRGEFIAASNPDEFTRGLKAALAAIVQRTGSFANLSTSSTSLRANTQGFQGSFVSGIWTGELKAYPVTATGIDTAAAPQWLASAGIPVAADRNILTWNGTAGASFPTRGQVAALGTNNADYIRGVRASELANGGTLRNRNHLLGDIVNSSPVYDPATDTVYVGANDGMLHAVNASATGGGAERFAYVPGAINLADLATLSDPAYSHRFFVDGPIALSRRDQTPNESWLAGTLGRGGNGLFVLDVTRPDAFATTDVKWERTTTPLNNMGKILGQPIIAKLNNNDIGLIVPNGVNSPNQRAALLIYNLKTGALLAEIDTGVGSAAAPNGLSAPTARDINGDGKIDVVYAGDLQGNLWRFDISSTSPSGWSNTSNRLALYSAGSGKPITSAPAFARDPATYEVWVFFGTGRFMTNGDLSDTSTQTLYGLKDATSVVRASDLHQRNTVITGMVNGRAVRGFELHAALPTDKKGWYMNLVEPPSPPGRAVGERIVSDVQVVAGVLIFSSIVPSSDPCLPGGSGYLNAMNAFTGTSLEYSFFDLDGDGDSRDESIDAGSGKKVPVGSIKQGGLTSLGALLSGGTGNSGLVCTNISDGSIECNRIRENRRVGRVSWREVVNVK